jgi:hypothetical protein
LADGGRFLLPAVCGGLPDQVNGLAKPPTFLQTAAPSPILNSGSEELI